MIKTDAAYENAVKRLKEDQSRIYETQKDLKASGMTEDEIRRVLEPEITFMHQLRDEVDWYERVRRGDRQAVKSLKYIGRLLIGLRIASGLSQRDLAEKLGVHESQVSRDERNEYFGIKTERAQEIIDALGGDVEVIVVSRSPKPAELQPA